MSTPPPRAREVVLIGLLVVVAATGFRAWALSGTWFFYDDFYFIQQAQSSGLTPGYLLTAYNSHLMPGGRLLTWLNVAVDPMGYTLPKVEIVVGLGLAGLGMLKLLLRLFGPRWGVIVPLVIFAFSPILLPAGTWWAAAVNQVPMLVATVFALDAFVGHLRAPTTRSLVVHVVWILVGLFFVERMLLVFVPMWLIAMMWFTSGSGPERLQRLWTSQRRTVLTHVVLVAAYLAAYVPLALDFNAATVIRRPFFEIVGDLVVRAFSAGFAGGPLVWETSRVTQQEAHPPPLFLLAAQALVVALVVVSARTRTRALRAWSLPVALLGANVALISVSRAIYFGPEIALDYRFQTEAALGAALAVAMAFLPVRDSPEASAARPGAWRADAPLVAVPALAAFVLLASVSTGRFPLRHLTDTSPERYLDTVVAQARAHPDAQLLNAPTPPWMWAPLAFPSNTYEAMFRALPVEVDVRRAVTDDAFLVDQTGAFQPIAFTSARALADRPTAGDPCRATLTGTTRSWDLDGPVFGFGWFARVDYVARGEGTLTVETDDQPSRVRLEKGRHTALVPVTGAFDAVGLRATPGSDVCLTDLRIGSVGLS